MSDKSFGEHLNRNIVKNPLLATAVTGLSIEDLTYNAVLLPVAPIQELITGRDHTLESQSTTLAHAEIKYDQGDAKSNIIHTSPPIFSINPVDSQHNIQQHDQNVTSTVSKASAKSDDDFDVNEYFARLQGTRYVSAPLNSLLADQNTNLEATEENLEEINLNEPDKAQSPDVQQSLTADIAQNFSQLPTVLPQVASAVFSSFSNMLSMKSREQTPDERIPQETGYQDVQFQRPEEFGVNLMGVEEPSVPKEIAPPPREPPVGGIGTANYRITTKKKAYAQIPGLNSIHNNAQNPQLNPNPISFNTNTTNQAPSEPYLTNIPNYNTSVFNPKQINPSEPSNNANYNTDSIPQAQHINIDPNQNYQAETAPQNLSNNLFNPLPVNDTIQNKISDYSNVQIFDPERQISNITIEAHNIQLFETERQIAKEAVQEKQTNLFTTIESQEKISAENNTNAPIIPPPPMFSNLPRRDSQSNVKSVLPPSLARRIGSNHPIIKPHSIPPMAKVSPNNIFVPAPLTTEELQSPEQFSSNTFLIDSSAQLNTKAEPKSVSVSSESAFVQFNTSVPMINSIAPGYNAKQPSDQILSNILQPDAISGPALFTPSSISQMDTAKQPMIFDPNNLAGLPTSLPGVAVPQDLSSQDINFQVQRPPTIQPLQQISLQTIPDLPAQPQSKQFGLPTSLPSQDANSQLSQQTFLQPLQQISLPTDLPIPNLGYAPEPPKPVPEPPKLSGNVNYRMTKKRPQYYSGPIEGVGLISNNVKPTVPTPAPIAFQGSVFSPEVTQIVEQTHNINPPLLDMAQHSVPLEPYSNFNITAPPTQTYPSSDYNTTFDMSRQTSDNYVPPKVEQKVFGIIGSLKSKLSSIDINKIQNTVTTFFDPAYNDTETSRQDLSYNQGAFTQNLESNIEVFVPSQAQIAVPDNQTYGHYDNQTNPYNYELANQQYQNQPYGNQVEVPAVDITKNIVQTQQTQQFYGASSSEIPVYASSNEPTSNIHSNQMVPNLSTHQYFDMRIQGTQNPLPYNTNKETVHPSEAALPEEKIPQMLQNVIECSLPNQTETKYPDTVSLVDINCETQDTRDNKSLASNLEKVDNSNSSEVKSISAAIFFDSDQFNISQPLHDSVLNQKLNSLHLGQESQMCKPEPENTNSAVFSQITAQLITEPGNDVDFFNNLTSIKNENSRAILAQSVRETDLKNLNSNMENYSLDFMSNADIEPQMKAAFTNQLLNLSANSDKDRNVTSVLDSVINKVSEFAQDSESSIEATNAVSKFGNKEIPESTDNNESSSDFNICETCREVNKPEDKDSDDFTTHLIENITSPIQLSNPVLAPLTEGSVDGRPSFDSKQCAEISHITEETMETIQVQSANELLDDVDELINSNETNYGWTTNQTAYLPPDVLPDRTYSFEIDSTALGFYGDNAMFFENIPNNASDEIKAEYKHSHEDSPVALPRQMSVPSAPPVEEDDDKSDETGLDVHLIEQDANKDFPVYEEFIIEPSETDDDKIEYKERERTSEEPEEVDTFTNRVERFKQMEEHSDNVEVSQLNVLFDVPTSTSPAITIASYFDTGNYAAETHYKNSITSPSSTFQDGSPGRAFRIPPGFEDEYKKKLSVMALQDSSDVKVEEPEKPPQIPETSTQTRPVDTTTFSNVTNTSETATVLSKTVPVKETLKEMPTLDFDNTPMYIKENSIIDRKLESGDTLIEKEHIVTSPIDIHKEQSIVSPSQALPDPISFFSSQEKIKPEKEETGGSFNRLASYFAAPAKNDHAKPFFELSQSQNHYRHVNSTINKSLQKNVTDIDKTIVKSKQSDNLIQNIPTNVYIQNLQLMNDLTSTRNFEVNPKEQILRTVNYFTVEYDSDIDVKCGINRKDFKNQNKSTDDATDNFESDNLELDNGIDLSKVVTNCKYCCNNDYRRVVTVNKLEIDTDFKVKQAMNTESADRGNKTDGCSEMDQKSCDKRKQVAITFDDTQNDDGEAVAIGTENRITAEYTPVKHHWFYRVDVEGKFIWRGFSTTDNKALEDAFLSPNLNETTLVPTDGGRFDVNIVGRLRIAVYWSEPPVNVLRCSWFYKGNMDARYVPYSEEIAAKLEEEYRHGVTTGKWHRRLVLPDSELVVMHGPSVMVHFPHAIDSFGSPPLFSFGKRVYRGSCSMGPTWKRPGLPPKVDHLLLLVHGAGEGRAQIERRNIQSTVRPHVVRRGCDETEIEDTEPSSIDHLLLLCHGVGSACDMRFRPVEEVVDDFRSTSLQLLQSHYRSSYDKGVVNRIEVLPISWHATLHSGETGVDRRLAAITLDSIPKLRNFTNDTVLDVLFYTSPVFCQTIIDTVCAELNRIYNLFLTRNPTFSGKVSLGGHSLGSVILYDLLGHQSPQTVNTEKSYVMGASGAGQTVVRYPSLEFRPAALFALGSPIAMFECIRGVKTLGKDFSLPTCNNFFNIFHPYDPIAYRIEPLICPQLGTAKPFLIPHHKGRKRMHLELKDTMARVGADLKQKLLESLKATWTSMWRPQPPPTDSQLEKVVEEEIEKEQLCAEKKVVEDLEKEHAGEEMPMNSDLASPEMLGKLNAGRRVDYVLQEAPFEMINEYLFAMSSHVCYWESEDTMLLILREIYDSLGVQPDSTIPQQTMTVQRQRQAMPNETIVYNTSEYPSTSRDGT